MQRPTPIKDAAVHRLAQSITQLTLCQVTTSEVNDATKLLEKARQKLQGIPFFSVQRRIAFARSFNMFPSMLYMRLIN